MRVTSKLAKAERSRKDRHVRQTAERSRMTYVTRISGPIHRYSSALATVVEAESANHLIWRQVQTKLTFSGKPLGESGPITARTRFLLDGKRVF
jgi:hypothetical protein